MTGIPLSNKHRVGCAGGGGEKPALITLVFSMGGSDILFKSGHSYPVARGEKAGISTNHLRPRYVLDASRLCESTQNVLNNYDHS